MAAAKVPTSNHHQGLRKIGARGKRKESAMQSVRTRSYFANSDASMYEYTGEAAVIEW